MSREQEDAGEGQEKKNDLAHAPGANEKPLK